MKKYIIMAFTVVVLLIVVICPAFAASITVDNTSSNFARTVTYDGYFLGIESIGAFCVNAKQNYTAGSFYAISKIYVKVKTVSGCGYGHKSRPDKDGVIPYVVSGTLWPWRSFTIKVANDDSFSISEQQ
jgi:hypothetical protein